MSRDAVARDAVARAAVARTAGEQGARPQGSGGTGPRTAAWYLQARAGAAGPGAAVAFLDAATGRSATWPDVAGVAGAWRHGAPVGPVGLALASPLDMAVNVVAALAAGATIAPLDPAAPPEDLARRARELGLRAVVTGASDTGPELAGVPRWRYDTGRLVATPAVATPAVAGPAVATPAVATLAVAGPAVPAAFCEAAVIMTSSGTTGPPKIIPLTEAQLVGTAERVARHLGLGAGDVGYSPLPLFHINGIVVGVLSALVAGSSLVVGRFSRRAFWPVVAAREVTWLNLVPAILAVLASSEAGPAGPAGPAMRVRLARSASAPLPPAVAARFEARYGIPVIESYGMTEAASQITANPLLAPRHGSVGLPVGVELRVVDGAARPVPSGLVGQVQVRGQGVAGTYWSASPGGVWTERLATDGDGWLTTGDLGWLDPDGYLYLSGREDDVINRGGEKIHPREVEDVLLADPRVIAAAVVARPHPTLGSEPVAYVLAVDGLDPGGRAELADALAVRCGSALSAFKRPAEIVIASSLPTASVGKVRRAELRRHLAASAASPGPPGSPP